MGFSQREQETICALATPPGTGGIAVIRISGVQSVDIVRKCFSNLPENPETHRVFYGFFCSLHEPHHKIDEVLVSFFGQGRSFTGEDTVEISCHGNPQIARDILNELILTGARAADRGEFTYRAFMNGRIDLIQAESVLDLIESKSRDSARVALRQLEGGTSGELISIEDSMIWCLAHLEASIDFSTEGIDVVDNSVLLKRVSKIEEILEKLVLSYKQGRLIKDGLKVVLAGQPNVGKSSLLNLLLKSERAIVTDTPGTTRDLVDGEIHVDGKKIVLVDTAGIREALDQVEKIGVQRSLEAAKEADAILFVFDVNRPLSDEEVDLLRRLDIEKTYFVANKSDQSRQSGAELRSEWGNRLANIEKLHSLKSALNERLFIVSALDQKDGQRLRDLLSGLCQLNDVQGEIVITNSRHFENLNSAFDNMKRVRGMIQSQASPELLSLEMKEALLRVQETVGKRFDDQILDRVFKEFCIGK